MMPHFDGTGPSGKDPLTGRKKGRCRESLNEQNRKEEDSNSAIKFSFRRGRGNNDGSRRRRGQGLGQRWGG
jgi:hypothetical protein